MTSNRKQELIQKMLVLQKSFIQQEHESGFDPAAYYAPNCEADIGSYQQEYTRLANELAELAHAEKGSSR